MIVIAVENWAREFRYKSDLAIYIARASGHKVILAPKNFVNLILPVLRGVYLHKSLQPHFEESVRALVNNGGRYLVIDEEAVIRDIDLSFRYGLDPKLCSFAFATSKAELDSFATQGYKNVSLTGNPRLLRSMNYRPQVKKNLQKVLFSSNFSMIRPAGDLTLEKVILDQSLDAVTADKLRNFITDHRTREYHVREYLIQLAEHLIVIYRVHPLESLVAAQGVFEGSKVLVTKGGDIGTAIKEADVVLHAGCTVALDAAQLGRKSGWLFISKDELTMEKSLLSIAFEVAPSSLELVALWENGEFSFNDKALIRSLMGDLECRTQEDSIAAIAQIVCSQSLEVSQLQLFDFVTKISPILIGSMRWLRSFYFNSFEKARYDRTARSELRKKCKIGLCKFSELPGGVFIIKPSVGE